ncbi:MAG: DUF2550 family protein [Propionibacterium sp.]|nr:DUF2550 family protein [Propionibacterium sp.]
MWWELLWIGLALVFFVLLPFMALYLRRRWITGQGGVFDCALQLTGQETGVGWSLGLGRYRGHELQWFRAFSWSLRPRKRFVRGQTHFVARRGPHPLEAVVLFDGSCILTVADSLTGDESNLAMTDEAAVALVSWLESAPPGDYLLRSVESPS